MVDLSASLPKPNYSFETPDFPSRFLNDDIALIEHYQPKIEIKKHPKSRKSSQQRKIMKEVFSYGIDNLNKSKDQSQKVIKQRKPLHEPIRNNKARMSLKEKQEIQESVAKLK